MTCQKVLGLLFLALTYPTAAFAQCSEPAIESKGILPGKTVYYGWDTSNGAWDSEEQDGISEALAKWTSANATSGLNVSFVENQGEATLIIYFVCDENDCPPGTVGYAHRDSDPLGFQIPRRLHW